MQWTGEWGISKMKSRLSHRETMPKLLRGKKYITCREEVKMFSAFSLKSQFLARNTKKRCSSGKGQLGWKLCLLPCELLRFSLGRCLSHADALPNQQGTEGPGEGTTWINKTQQYKI